jgi:opacity protein-like surface antigen
MNPINKRQLYILAAATLFITSASAATTEDTFKHRYYIGVTGGYGETTWEGLVPKTLKNHIAMMFSTPVRVAEGGALWGVALGYEMSPYFALEGSYARYPNAKVSFDGYGSLFTLNHHITELNTHTETTAINNKIMLIIPNTILRVYSSFGVAGTHRYDQTNDRWRVSPTFGAGVNYNFTDHIMGEFGANYTAGYGESELSPSEDYIPFLYSVFLRVAYRFSI